MITANKIEFKATIISCNQPPFKEGGGITQFLTNSLEAGLCWHTVINAFKGGTAFDDEDKACPGNKRRGTGGGC